MILRNTNSKHNEPTIVQDIIKAFSTELNRDDLTIQLPKAFEQLAEEQKIELTQSNPIQSVDLFYSHNMITHSIAVVFVNTTCLSSMGQLSSKEKEKALISELKKEHNVSKDKIKKYIANMTAD